MSNEKSGVITTVDQDASSLAKDMKIESQFLRRIRNLDGSGINKSGVKIENRAWETKNFDTMYMRRELFKTKRLARNFLKLSSDNQQINLNNKFVRTLLIYFQTAFYEEIERVSTFYSFESVKILSLSYDVLAKLQDLRMHDFEMVQEALEELNDSMVLILKVIYFIENNLNLIKAIFKEYLDTFPGVEKTKIFTSFASKELSNKRSPLRILVEQMALYKGYTTVMFITQKMSPEIRKAKEYVENQEEDSDAEFDEFRVGPHLNETREQMTELLAYSKNVQKMLDNNTDYFMKRDNSYWFQLGLTIVELNGIQELLSRVDFFFQDRALTKDDYIKASLQPHERVMDYSYEAEPDQACGDMVSLWIVLAHTMIYVTNYYGLYITSYVQLKRFEGIDTSKAAYIIAATPLAATACIYYYEAAFSRLFFTMHHQSFVLLLLANLLNFLATTPSINSLTLVVLARCLYGAGGIRIVTKKYIALMVSRQFRQRYLLILAVISNVGKALGPGISALLLVILDALPDSSGWVHEGNIYSLFFVIVWLVFYLAILFGFRAHMRLIIRYLSKIKRQSKCERKKYETLLRLEAQQLRKLANDKEEEARNKDNISPKNKKSLEDIPALEFPLGEAATSQLPAISDRDKKFQWILNKLITVFFIIAFIFTKAVLESLYCEAPVLMTHKNWYNFSLKAVGLIQFCYIVLSRNGLM